MENLKLGKINLIWLNGGVIHLDGGAMFGVVPKPLWSRKYPCNERNQIEMRCDPILVQKEDTNILIDSGIGTGKLSEKEKRNLRVYEESHLDETLAAAGLTREDIDIVAMTHLHFDHASGLTGWNNKELVPTFPKAKIVVSAAEVDEMLEPTARAKSSYRQENWVPIRDYVDIFDREVDIVPGIKMVHVGGHSRGHSILILESEGKKAIHLSDLMSTHAHQNPLWVLAYDDFPLTSVSVKQKWLDRALHDECWFLFYHDAFYRAICWNKNGDVIGQMERKRPDGKKITELLENV